MMTFVRTMKGLSKVQYEKKLLFFDPFKETLHNVFDPTQTLHCLLGIVIFVTTMLVPKKIAPLLALYVDVGHAVAAG